MDKFKRYRQKTEKIEFNKYFSFVKFSFQDGCFFGKIENAKGCVLYDGKTKEEAIVNFRKAILEYENFLKEI